MEFIGKNKIKLDRLFGELDNFVFRFIRTLEKYADYVIVSGYVAILFGRSRATEDVDVFIREINKNKMSELYKALLDDGLWCLNADDLDEIYNLLKEGNGIRFAENGSSIPNIEVKFALKSLHKRSFDDMVEVLTKKGSIWISSIEQQIAFKKFFLGSEKDMEDARHLEKAFKEQIDYKKVEEYKKIIENEKA